MDADMHQPRPDEGSQPRAEISLPVAVKNFTEELCLLQHAGLPLLRSLQIAANIEPHRELKGALEQIVRDVEGGSTLGQAMKERQGVFPERYRSLVVLGERTGALDAALRIASGRLEPGRSTEANLPQAVRDFTEHMSFLQNQGLPLLRALQMAAKVEANAQLRGIVEQVADDVEAGSSLSEAMGIHKVAFSGSYQKMINAGEIGGVLDIALQRVVEKIDWDAKIESSRTPEYTSIEVRRFANSLGSYIGLGVPILEAIRLAKEGQNEPFGQAVDLVHDAIREGEGMAQAMKKSPHVFDGVFVQFVDIGEETGDLDKTLLSFARRSPELN